MDHSEAATDSRILGQLLAAQSTLSIFSERQRIGEFVHRAVEGIPGVSCCAVCISGGGRSQLQVEVSEQCTECKVLEGKFGSAPGSHCLASSLPGCLAMALQTQEHHFGYLVIKESDHELFEPYEPFANNLAVSVAVNLERQWHKERLEAANAELVEHREHLEELVLQRTTALQEKIEEQNRFFTLDLALLCIADMDGHFKRLNHAWEKTLGYSMDELIDRPFMDFVHPDDQESALRALEDQRQQKEIIGFVNRYRHKDGSYRWIEWRSSPMGNHVYALAMDITDRKQAEAERERLEERLRGSQKMEAIGRLAGGVAHDFNNLLSVILSYADFALEELEESDPIREDIVEIHTAGERAAALTSQLLAFSRKLVLKPTVINLNTVVADMESMVRRLLGEDIDIVVELAEDLGRVKADPGQIEQVIMNLAVNARDAMPLGGKLTVETQNMVLDQSYTREHPEVTPGQFVLLSVADTGSGMSAEAQERIFEPFYTTKQLGKGTGLGLATVYGIVKQSGGNILVYSEEGQGTAFKVYLPRVDAPVTSTDRSHEAVPTGGSETVLIVEDESAVRRLAERILRKGGYEVLAAANGGEALLLCEQHGTGVDMLLTDVVMPRMSGRELAGRLVEHCPELKVLYMSGYTDNAIVHHGVLDEGMSFISKPFSAAELAFKVRQILDGQPAP